MLAIGAGGLDVAMAMAGEPFHVVMPQVVRVKLTGHLPPWVSAKDVILEMLRRLTVKGGVGRVFEYGGEGVASLSVPERATITNMGAELGATSSIFPSDERTREYLRAQSREDAWKPLSADADAEYDEVIELDLSALEPLIALPSSPDNVVPVREVAGTEVAQVVIGSCTNSSYLDLMTVAAIVKGKIVSPGVSAVVNPGTRQVMLMLAENGALADLIAAGFRVLEIVLRAVHRHGAVAGDGHRLAADLQPQLPRPQRHPRRPGLSVQPARRGGVGAYRRHHRPARPRRGAARVAARRVQGRRPDDHRAAGERRRAVPVVRGPNIKPLPRGRAAAGDAAGDRHPQGRRQHHDGPHHARRLEDPAAALEHPGDGGARLRAGRRRLRQAREGGGQLHRRGGSNYGQGSSREHAALAPMYLGLRAVLAKSFARIHRANLVNVGILPLVFVDERDYDRIAQGDELEIDDVRNAIRAATPSASAIGRRATSSRRDTGCRRSRRRSCWPAAA